MSRELGIRANIRSTKRSVRQYESILIESDLLPL